MSSYYSYRSCSVQSSEWFYASILFLGSCYSSRQQYLQFFFCVCVIFFILFSSITQKHKANIGQRCMSQSMQNRTTTKTQNEHKHIYTYICLCSFCVIYIYIYIYIYKIKEKNTRIKVPYNCIYCILSCCHIIHIFNINMWLHVHLFNFTEITDCVLCVLNLV